MKTCDICLRYPHMVGCPNEPAVMNCPHCHEFLYEGNTWYPEIPACEFCVEKFAQIVRATNEE